jgi:hypothetical protein
MFLFFDPIELWTNARTKKHKNIILSTIEMNVKYTKHIDLNVIEIMKN